LTVYALYALQTTTGPLAEYAITGANIAEGLQFNLPENLGTAFAAFGMIGVGASELIYYPYWCLEKGYSRNIGTQEDNPEWYARAQGWLKIMRIDAWISMAIYTSATVVFFLLGAALLYPPDIAVEKVQGIIKDTVPSLEQRVSRLGSVEARKSFELTTNALSGALIFPDSQSDKERKKHIKGKLENAVVGLKAISEDENLKIDESKAADAFRSELKVAVEEMENASVGVSDKTMIPDLSRMFDSLGPRGLMFFLVGAFVVLFSTLASASASNARLLADTLVLFKIKSTPENKAARQYLISQCCVFIPCACAVLFVFLGKPVTMVLIGGVAQAFMLVPLSGAALYFRYRTTAKPLQPGMLWTVMLWISAIAMAMVGLYMMQSKVREQFSPKPPIGKNSALDAEPFGKQMLYCQAPNLRWERSRLGKVKNLSLVT